MTKKKPTCLFIDPYVSSEMISDTMHQKKIRCIALFTYIENLKIPFKNELFDEIIYFKKDNQQEILNNLKKDGISFVQSGREYSLEFSDEIAAQLCPKYANNPSTTFQRVDKFEMQEAIRKFGLRATLQHKLVHAKMTKNDRDKLEKFHYPVILKPLEASGSLGINVCITFSEIQKSFKESMGKRTPLGSIVEGVVVQELLQGDEYIVDSMSLGGQHATTCVFRYGKTLHDQTPIYRYADVISFKTDEAKSCCEYIKKTLHAIGLNNGLSHAELFLTPEGPCLVEVNARISGLRGFLNHVARRVFGINQVDVLAEIIKNPTDIQKYLSLYSEERCHGRVVVIQNFHQKILSEFNSKGLLQSLPSYDCYQSFIKSGQQHHGAKVLSDAIAFVSLVHSNQQQIEEDSERIWEWEQNHQLF